MKKTKVKRLCRGVYSFSERAMITRYAWLSTPWVVTWMETSKLHAKYFLTFNNAKEFALRM
jgi:hypothetical protein